MAARKKKNETDGGQPKGAADDGQIKSTADDERETGVAAGEQQEGNLFVNLNNDYYHFTASEKKVADYVLSNKIGAQYMSITGLAYECGVAEATITRFCRRLGLSGYGAFKVELAKAVAEEQGGNVIAPEDRAGEISSQDSVTEMARKLCGTETSAVLQSLNLLQPDEVTKAVDLLRNAHRVICIGQGGSMIMAMEYAHLFSTVSTRFTAIQDIHMQFSAVSLMDPGDVLLFISYSGSTKEIVELMGLAQSRGASVILVTRFARSPGATQSDVVLQCGSNEGPLQLGSITAQMAQLFVLDVLYNEFVRRDPDGANAKKESIAKALAERHL